MHNTLLFNERKYDDDYYSQLDVLLRPETRRGATIVVENTAHAMHNAELFINQHVRNYYKTAPVYETGIATALGIDSSIALSSIN